MKTPGKPWESRGKPRENPSKIVSVLLSTLVKRFFVSRMRDFYLQLLYYTQKQSLEKITIGHKIISLGWKLYNVYDSQMFFQKAPIFFWQIFCLRIKQLWFTSGLYLFLAVLCEVGLKWNCKCKCKLKVHVKVEVQSKFKCNLSVPCTLWLSSFLEYFPKGSFQVDKTHWKLLKSATSKYVVGSSMQKRRTYN